MLKSITLSIFLLIGSLLFSQEPRKDFPVGLNLHLGGPGGILGVSIDAFVTPAINLEVGIGSAIFFGSIYGGVKYHSDSESGSNWSLYSGAMGIVTSGTYDSQRTIETTKYIGLLYVPVGIHYIAGNGFTFGAELSGIFDKKADLFTNHIGLWAGLKIGFHFSLKDNLPKTEKQKSTYKDENIQYEPGY